MTTPQNIAREDEAITAIRFPIRLLTVACLLTITAFAGFGWTVFDELRDAKMFAGRLSRIEELRGVIVHLDEVLTTSARMAATTGDLQWEKGYRHFEPQLDAAIKETTRMGTGSVDVKAATKTDEANIKLVEMENRVFALVRAGGREEAQGVLSNREYETQKDIYAEGITSFVNQLRRAFGESWQDDKRTNLLLVIAAMVVGGISLVSWLSAVRGMRRWRSQLSDSLQQRAEAEENLREAHVKLEVRVKERTADFAKINATLQEEITERKRVEWQLNIQYEVSRILTESSTLKEASGRILQTVCEKLNWEVGDFYALDRRAGVLRFDDMWAAPGFQLDAFNTLSRQTTFGHGVGLPGRVWADGKPVWIPDVVVDKNFPRLAAAKQAGLHSAFSFPVSSGNELSGIMEFFSREIRQPDEELLRVFTGLGSQLGQFFQRKQAQAAWAGLAAIVESSDDAIISKNLDGIITTWNRGAEKVFGYTADEMIGTSIMRLIPADRHDDESHIIGRIKQGLSVEHFETERLTKNGRLIDVSVTASPMRDGTGVVIGASKVARDITQRRRTEEAVRAAEEKYRSIFENSSDGIFQNTPDGRMISANPAFARMLGFASPEELIRERTNVERQSYVEPGLREGFQRLLEEQGSVSNFEYQVRRKDGTRIWVSENTRLIRDEAGQAVLYEGSAQEITERKRSEAEREVISEIEQGVVTTNNLAELLALAHRSIGRLLYAENCFVGLHDVATDLVNFEFWIDQRDLIPAPQPISNGSTRSSYVLRTGVPLLLTAERRDQLFEEGQLARSGSISASWLGVPLRTPTRTIGILAVQHYEKGNVYNERDLEFLASVGNQIALAIERKLAEETLRKSEVALGNAQRIAHLGS